MAPVEATIGAALKYLSKMPFKKFILQLSLVDSWTSESRDFTASTEGDFPGVFVALLYWSIVFKSFSIKSITHSFPLSQFSEHTPWWDGNI